jgi:hypothetical protein
LGKIYILQLLYSPTKFKTTAIKLFYSDNLTSLDKLNLLLNLPTIPQDKEVKLNIKLKMRWHTIIEVEVPPLYITSELELVYYWCGRPHKNTLLV